MTDRSPPIVVIAGPTGVGKSALALEIAERMSMEIVCADSRQVYRYLDIGTGKPTVEERARVPHHLVDYIDPDQPYSVARYRDDGDIVLADLGVRGIDALVVGGTGHYVQALVDRIEPPRVPPRPDLRAELERRASEGGAAELHAELRRLDPETAAAVPAENIRRVIRALEVIDATGRPFSEVGRRRGQPRAALRLVLTMPRVELYRRQDIRVQRMMEAGWLEEVRKLLARGYDRRLPAFSSTGYRELAAVVEGELGLEEAIQKVKWRTHAYARRQYIWLRRQPGYEWIDADPGGYARAAALVEAYLAGSLRRDDG